MKCGFCLDEIYLVKYLDWKWSLQTHCEDCVAKWFRSRARAREQRPETENYPETENSPKPEKDLDIDKFLDPEKELEQLPGPWLEPKQEPEPDP